MTFISSHATRAKLFWNNKNVILFLNRSDDKGIKLDNVEHWPNEQCKSYQLSQPYIDDEIEAWNGKIWIQEGDVKTWHLSYQTQYWIHSNEHILNYPNDIFYEHLENYLERTKNKIFTSMAVELSFLETNRLQNQFPCHDLLIFERINLLVVKCYLL